MADNEKIILDVRLEYKKSALKDKVSAVKDSSKEKDTLDKEEAYSLATELAELKEQEAVGAVKLRRQGNLIFVRDQPNRNTRQRYPIATAVTGEYYNTANPPTLEGYTVRPSSKPEEKVYIQEIKFPGADDIPYVFVDVGKKLYNSTTTGIVIESNPFNGGAFNRSVWPGYEPYVNDGQDCLKPARGSFTETRPTYSYFKNFDMLLPLNGTVAIYILYRKYWYSYAHIFAANIYPQIFTGECFEPFGDAVLATKFTKKQDLWSDTLARAFLIDDTQIKEIPFPSQLKERLSFLVGEPDYTPRTQPIPYTENTIKLTGFEYPYDNPPLVDAIYDSETDKTYDPSLLWSYGLGRYNETPHGSDTYFSPAVYSFLREYNGEYQGTEDIHEYAKIKELYNLKSRGFVTLGDTEVFTSKDDVNLETHRTEILYTALSPTNSMMALENEPEKVFVIRSAPNSINIKYAVKEDTTGAARVLYAWDGGQPSYCLGQATELGFASDSLTFS